MKKFAFQFVALLIAIFAGIYFSTQGRTIPIPSTTEPPKKVLQINDAKISVDIADTQPKRSKGLGGRDKIATNEGMLFIFPKEDRVSFWMKGLNFPLDIIWIKGDRVVDVLTNVKQPDPGEKDETLPIYQPVVAVDKVLEVNAGVADKLGIRVGDPVKLVDE